MSMIRIERQNRHLSLIAVCVLIVCAAVTLGFRRSFSERGAAAQYSAPAWRITPPLAPTKSLRDYYVSPAGSDEDDGSQQRPWQTIQHATAVAKAGATVHVAAGNYSGPITTETNGTASARIRFVSDVQ